MAGTNRYSVDVVVRLDASHLPGDGRAVNSAVERMAQRAAQQVKIPFSRIFSADFFSGLAERAAVSVGHTLVATIEDAFNRAATFDALKRGLTSVTGSAAETERQLLRLREAAKQPGLTFRGAIEGVTQLQATGMSAEFAERSVRAFGNALASVGRNSRENLRGVHLALTQISTTPFLQGDELRQLQERLPQVSRLLVDAFGTARSEDIKKMGITSKQVLETLVSGLEKIPRVTGGAGNALENLADAWDQALVALGEPLLEPVAESLTELAAALDDNKALFQLWGGVVADTIRGVTAVSESGLGRLISQLAAVGALIASSSPGNVLGRGASPVSDIVRDAVNAGSKRALEGAGPLTPPARQAAVVDKALEKQRDILQDLRTEIRYFGNDSARAATEQKLLAAGVTDLNSGLARQALALADVVDRMRDAAEMEEMIQERLKDVKKFAESVEDQLAGVASEARKRTTEIINEIAGRIPGELFKFDVSPLGQQAASMTERQTEQNKELVKTLNDARNALAELDRRAADVEPFKKRQEAFKSTFEAVQGFIDGVDEELRDLRYVSDRRTPIDDLFESLFRLKDLQGIGVTKGAFDEIQRFMAGVKTLEAEDVEVLRMAVSTILLTAAPASADPQKLSLLIEKIVEAIQKANEAAEKLTPLERERQALATRLEEAQNAVALAAETASQRYELAWQEAFNSVALADDAARISMIESQVRLADATTFHADRANAAVLDYLASQRDLTTVISDFRINVMETTFSVIDRGLERATSKLGIMGDLVRDLISGFIRLALNRAFQSMMLGGQPGQASGGGFSLGNIFGSIFGGFGGASTPPFVPSGGFSFAGGVPSFGGSFGAGSNPFANFFGGGLTPPQTTAQAQQQMAVGRIIQQTAAGGKAPGLFGAGGLFQAQGGGLSGSGAATALAAHVGIFEGLFGRNTRAALGPLGFLSPLASSPFIAGLPLFGFLQVFGRSRIRRQEEGIRNQLSNDTGQAIWGLIAQAQAGKLGLDEARNQFNAIKTRYFDGISQLKDSKTKRIATETWSHFQALWPLLEQNARQVEEARDRSGRLIPAFADGGAVSGFMRHFSGRVPGRFDRRDDKLIRVSGNEVVLTPEQWQPIAPYLKAKQVPGFQAGGHVSASTTPAALSGLNFNVTVNMPAKGDVAEVVLEVLESSKGGSVITRQVKSARVNREL